MRRALAFILTSLMVAAFLPLNALAADGPPQTPDGLRAFNITPPGQDGTVTTDEFIAGDYGPNYDDQLEMYASLINDDDVTEEELATYFHSMQFGPGEEPGDPETPKEGLQIYRDGFGVPHIYGDTLDDASFGLGYVTAQDRLFQMDVFRHAARGTLAGFIGPGANDQYLQMDIDTRREGYTDEEITAMYEDLDDKFGEIGAQVQTGLQAYTDGVNAWMDEVFADPSLRPVEYEATGNPFPQHPEAWNVNDTLFLVVLQLREFGETAGGEVENAGLLTHLQKRLGNKKGLKTFNDLFFQNDARSPVTIAPEDANFKTQDLGQVDWSSVAIPDDAEAQAEEERRRRENRQEILASMGFKKPASNALIVSAEESATGNPLLLGGPQVGHAVPSFFLDVDVHAPGVDFRGPAVPGASALIPLGRGKDYAWTLTTGYSDAVDTRAELLCDPEGGEPTEDSNFYMFKGQCLEMESREETFESKPPPTDPGPPDSEDHTFYRTIHGPVFTRGKVDGKPVAFVKERMFWMKEIDSITPFLKWNTQVENIDDFRDAAREFTMSFNAFYVDHKDIGYFHVGLYPRRVKGQSPSLPTWGTGKWEWKGRRSFFKQPKIIDPPQGWLSNWNNKPAQGWDNQDSLKWGSIQRMQMLADRMHQVMDGAGKAELSDLADVIRDAATRDARGVYLAPIMLRKARKRIKKGSQLYGPALDLLAGWIDGGAHRYNRDDDPDNMDEGAALAVYDRWYEKLVHAVFDDEVGAGGYAEFPGLPIVNFTPENGGGFFADFSSYLRNMFVHRYRKKMFFRNYCNDFQTGPRETCVDVIASSLEAALAELTEEQGEDMSAWTSPAENLTFDEQGAGGVDEIPWQNRGSENHLVEVLQDLS